MAYTHQGFRFGPEQTPSLIKKLIFITILISVGSALTNNLFTYFLEMRGPQEWLSLSWWGMSNYFWWQPITYLFVQHTGYEGISTGFLAVLAFNMYILWAMGSDLYHRIGKTNFLGLYFISGIAAGLITFLLMIITRQFGIISGAAPSILAVLVAWTLLYPENELSLFFLIPVKAKWLTTGILGAALLISLSNLYWVGFSLTFFGATTGYLYALIAWGLHSPFHFMYRFELATIRLSQKIRRFFPGFGKSKQKESKIFDISTGKTIKDDDDFVDAMLKKMSKHGPDSLTWQEKQRMQKITEKKSQ